MATVTLEEVDLPEFGTPETRPELSKEIYDERLRLLRRRASEAGLDVLILYADREHSANIAYATGFEPRFEEALLVLAPGRAPTLIAGPENQGYAAVSPVELELALYPPFGLLGQDRRRTPPLSETLAAAGVAQGQTVGVAGWKYFGPEETPEPDAWIEAPAYIVDGLRALVGSSGRVVNATRLLMHASDGLRARSEIDQIAQFEFSAAHVSEAIKRVLFGLRPDMREFEAARLLAPIGLPLSCHPMLSSGARARLGLASPSDQPIARGAPFMVAYGVWGALSCRAGWLVAEESELPADAADYLDRLARPYFDCVAAWYETVGIGVAGGEIFDMVRRRLGDPFFGVTLNPGHLIHLDEWMNSPIYENSAERLQSGQTLQMDIIPATNSPYFSINGEDGIALLDADGRAALAERFPQVWSRIEARRAFMADALGVRLKPETLPLSNLAGALPPFILSPKRILSRR